MPAKRNILPRPCPECGSDYGGLRIGIFSGKRITDVMIRVKHYNPYGYAEVKREIKEKHLQKNKLVKKKIMRKQQKWCSVRIDKQFASKYEPRIELHFDDIENYDTFEKIINFEWKPGEKFLHAVKKYGWNDLPKYSEKYYKQRDVTETTSHIRKNIKK